MKIVTGNKELEDNLRIKLIDKFNELLKLDPDIEGIFKQLETPTIKEGVISEITGDRLEQHILDNMYYNVLYKLEMENIDKVKKCKLKKEKVKRKKQDYGGIKFYLFASLFESLIGRNK